MTWLVPFLTKLEKLWQRQLHSYVLDLPSNVDLQFQVQVAASDLPKRADSANANKEAN